MSETEKPARYLAQAEVKMTNVDKLFPSATDNLQLKVGDMISFGLFNDKGKKTELATILLTEFRAHPDKSLDKSLCLPVFRLMHENTNIMDGFMIKADPGFLLFEDKEQIRVISHMLVAHEMKNFTFYHPIKTSMDKTTFQENFKKMLNEALLEVPEDEIVEEAYVGIEYIRS